MAARSGSSAGSSADVRAHPKARRTHVRRAFNAVS